MEGVGAPESAGSEAISPALPPSSLPLAPSHTCLSLSTEGPEKEPHDRGARRIRPDAFAFTLLSNFPVASEGAGSPPPLVVVPWRKGWQGSRRLRQMEEKCCCLGAPVTWASWGVGGGGGAGCPDAWSCPGSALSSHSQGNFSPGQTWGQVSLRLSLSAVHHGVISASSCFERGGVGREEGLFFWKSMEGSVFRGSVWEASLGLRTCAGWLRRVLAARKWSRGLGPRAGEFPPAEGSPGWARF